MDRALLERMVGAVVLLLLLVFVAPALLDGSREEAQPGSKDSATIPTETRVETIVLDIAPGSDVAASAESAVPPPPEPEVKPPPQPEPKPAPKPEPKPAPKPEPKPEPKPAPKPEAKPTPKPEPKPAPTQTVAEPPGSFIVQLGSFSERKNAESFFNKVKARGFSVKLTQVATDSGPRYRVYVGPRPTREAADELAAIMANSGYKGMIKSIDGEGS